MMKARFPPTQAESFATGGRSNNISAWSGPCRIIDRMSSTTYKMIHLHLDSDREFERSITNLLSWNAQSQKNARNAQYDENVTASFTVNEFIAVRDEPQSWFFLAEVTTVKPTNHRPLLWYKIQQSASHYLFARLASFPLGPYHPLRITTRTPHTLLWCLEIECPQQLTRRQTTYAHGGITPNFLVTTNSGTRSQRTAHLRMKPPKERCSPLTNFPTNKIALR